MRKQCRIIIADDVNCRIEGLDARTERRVQKALTWRDHSARHSAKFQLGTWSGNVSLYNAGWTYTTLLNAEVMGVIESTHDPEVVDDRSSVPVECELTAADVAMFEEYMGGRKLWEHQINAVNIAFANRMGMLELATGAGKTSICSIITKKMLEHGRVVTIVPTTDLVTQTAKTYRSFGIDVGEWDGSKKQHKDAIITTWQSLQNAPELLEGVVCLLVDEAHGAKATVIHEILSGAGRNVPHRYGFTGTIPKADLDTARIRAVLGEVLYRVPAHVLQDKGILAKCHVNVVQSNEMGKEFVDYFAENAYLVTDPHRLAWAGMLIREIAETGNTLVLVRNIATGKSLKEAVGAHSIFMSGSTKNRDRKQTYDSIGSLDGVPLICTVGIASTGIDIPRLFNIVLFEPGRAFEKIIQSIGRGLRLADDKDFANIYDICANTKFSKKQLGARKSYYREAKYPYTILQVEYR